MNDADVAKAQLESWVENKTELNLVLENGFAVGFNEYGTLERWESGMIFRNSMITVTFEPQKAIQSVLFEDRCYQVRLKYPHGLLTIYDRRWKSSVTEQED